MHLAALYSCRIHSRLISSVSFVCLVLRFSPPLTDCFLSVFTHICCGCVLTPPACLPSALNMLFLRRENEKTSVCCGMLLWLQLPPWRQTPHTLFLRFVLMCVNVSPQRAHQYLVSKGKSSSNVRLFKSQLHLIWFHLYRRERNTG